MTSTNSWFLSIEIKVYYIIENALKYMTSANYF